MTEITGVYETHIFAFLCAVILERLRVKHGAGEAYPILCRHYFADDKRNSSCMCVHTKLGRFTQNMGTYFNLEHYIFTL
jgi:hypothetical protein